MRVQLFALLILLIVSVTAAQNNTFVATEVNDSINNTTGNIDSTITVLQAATKLLEAFQSAIIGVTDLKNTVENLGFTNSQATALFLLVLVIIFYFFLRILKLATKWIVLAVFAWLVLQILGIL